MSEKQTMKELIILMRDTFTGKIHVDDAIKKFNQFIEETEDFEHENRIYALEGKFKASEEPCENCGFKENCKPSITQVVYDDIKRLWDETYQRTKDDNEPIIALERFNNKYEVR